MVYNFYNLGMYFEYIAEQHSNEVAVSFDYGQIAYKELNKVANQIANFLISRNIYTNDVVGIYNSKTVNGYAAMLACLKIGAAYTNFDSENPIERQDKIFSTCKPKLVLTDYSLDEQTTFFLKSKGIEACQIYDDNLFRTQETSNLPRSKKIIGSCPAYIMFTSGSTGHPKGVVISHLSVISFIAWSVDRFKITPEDRFAQVSPLYFDNSVFDFYTALFSGASLLPINRKEILNANKLASLLSKYPCTIWFSVPTLLIYLQKTKLIENSIFRSIRAFIFGGEGFPKSQLKKLFYLVGDRAHLINVYGPTEATCICSAHQINVSDFDDMSRLAPLGKLNQNFQGLILDNELNEVSPGEKGELCLLGPNLALGYFNNLEKTKEKFIQNPKVPDYSNTMYRTGDLVMEKDGLLWFLGRVDNQIKHLGYRIELEEIETALNSISNLRQSVVTYQESGNNNRELVAHIVSIRKTSAQDIITKLRSILPYYMIPKTYNFYTSLPTNQNGKVDKKALERWYKSK